jgi:hypothetical protein
MVPKRRRRQMTTRLSIADWEEASELADSNWPYLDKSGTFHQHKKQPSSLIPNHYFVVN